MIIKLSGRCPFDLDLTLCCGQAFRWDKKGDWWYGVVGERVFKVRQFGEGLEFENADEVFVKDYLGLHDPLPNIFSQISKDRHIETAIERFKGLRILRQDPWECLISYICATYKNIAAIERMLLRISEKFGDETSLDGYSFFTFPHPSKLAEATPKELAECELGYRAKYVSQTAKEVSQDSYALERLKRAPYDVARHKLLSFSGVGPKVADCVLLFSFGRLEAFPIDVWIRRAVLRHYARHFQRDFVRRISLKRSLSTSEYKRLSLFGRDYFGKYAGYAQEYLYHCERTHSRS